MRSKEWPPIRPTIEDLLAAAIDKRRIDGHLEPSAYAWNTARALLEEHDADVRQTWEADLLYGSDWEE